MTATETLPTAETIACRPWPRLVLPRQEWSDFTATLAERPLVLLALWADTQQVHALFRDPLTQDVAAVSTPVEAGAYPALSPAKPNAAAFERMIADLWGHEAEGAAPASPWLDHGQWLQARPMAARPEPARLADPPPEPVDTDTPLMQLSLGPIHGRVTDAARLRLQVRDGSIAVAEGQLGFSHKGAMVLMRGKSPRTAARFAARLAGDSTVAHSLAFALAAEAALGVEAPDRAVALRGVMLEIERVAVHLDTLAEVARLAGAARVHAQCSALREHVLRATAEAFGHRLMMDCVVPGGVAVEMADNADAAILRVLGQIASALPGLRRLHEGSALASRLSGVGRVGVPLLVQCGAGGPAARAAGHGFDARMLNQSGFVPAARARRPDTLGRQQQRLDEIEGSLRLISTTFQRLPFGPLTVALPQESGEGIGCAESARGDVWHWLRLDHGQIATCFPRDPGWALWPAAEAVLLGAAVEDAGLIAASFGLSVSGMDL
ncbi:MAG: hypothetical protein JSS43_07425 [Proteobacteria bacterium]|nr:hypothetical protein [Pseudomonadota bacterium]